MLIYVWGGGVVVWFVFDDSGLVVCVMMLVNCVGVCVFVGDGLLGFVIGVLMWVFLYFDGVFVCFDGV